LLKINLVKHVVKNVSGSGPLKMNGAALGTVIAETTGMTGSFIVQPESNSRVMVSY
jgi:hypothetical protein